MNYAKLDNSDRLKRVLDLLKDHQWHSTRRIINKAHVCAVNSIAAELRSNGHPVECKRVGNVWRYRLGV